MRILIGSMFATKEVIIDENDNSLSKTIREIYMENNVQIQSSNSSLTFNGEVLPNTNEALDKSLASYRPSDGDQFTFATNVKGN